MASRPAQRLAALESRGIRTAAPDVPSAVETEMRAQGLWIRSPKTIANEMKRQRRARMGKK